MNWNDYEAAWKRQKLPVGAAADLTNLRETFEAKRRKLSATLLIRDWIELIACGLGVAAYAGFWRKVGAAGWPMALAIACVFAVAAVFVRERLRTRRNRLSVDATLLAKIEADLAELRHQRNLLLNVWRWYLGPCAAAVFIHATVIVRATKAGALQRDPLFLLGVGVLFVITFWFAWAINQRAVRKQIEPRLEELEKLRRDLLSSQ